MRNSHRKRIMQALAPAAAWSPVCWRHRRCRPPATCASVPTTRTSSSTRSALSDWATESEKDTAATELAARINASDYDVLVLNEVMDEDARSIIHTQTRAKYPYQVVKV